MEYTSNKRIAKNTLYLYGRMIMTMLVSLYTSRVVLQSLGVVDFGIYNVIGGVVTMLGFFSSSLATSTQRFLNVGMSTESALGLRRIFSTAINAHIIIGILSVVLLEAFGPWFIGHKLVIPTDRLGDAYWVFHCSVLTFFISIVSVPYNAAIIAHEKMSAFAWMSIVEVLAKLIIAYALIISTTNRLIIYAILLVILSLLMRTLYNAYCIRHFPECKYLKIWDKSLMKQMFSFSGWMIFGCCTDLLNGQGVNILINIFFGPIYNASRAIAMQVQTAIAQFSANFILSVNPQITKSYAAKEYDSCYRLVYLASKMSIFLMMFMIIPVILHSYTILNLWLGDVPSEANLFVNLILINYLVRSTYSPIAQINQAYGKVKLYQLLISLLYIVNFAGSYWLFKIGFPVISTFVLSIVISIIGLAVRLWVLHYQVQFPSKDYFYNVVVRSLIVLCITYAVCWLVKDISSHEIVNLLISCVLSIITSALTIWFIGFNKSERNGISHYALSKLAILRKFKH